RRPGRERRGPADVHAPFSLGFLASPHRLPVPQAIAAPGDGASRTVEERMANLLCEAWKRLRSRNVVVAVAAAAAVLAIGAAPEPAAAGGWKHDRHHGKHGHHWKGHHHRGKH